MRVNVIVKIDERLRRIVTDVKEDGHDRKVLVRDRVNVLDSADLLQDALTAFGDEALHFFGRCAGILRDDDGGGHRDLRVLLTGRREDREQTQCGDRRRQRRRQLRMQEIFRDAAGEVASLHRPDSSFITATRVRSVSLWRLSTATSAPHGEPASTGTNRTLSPRRANTPFCPARFTKARAGIVSPLLRMGIRTRAYIPGDKPERFAIAIRSVTDRNAGLSVGATARIVPRRRASPSASTRIRTGSPAYTAAPTSSGKATSSARAASFSSVTIGAPGPTTAPTSTIRAVTIPGNGARTTAS